MFYLLEDNRIIDSKNEKDISRLKWDYNCEFHSGKIYFYKPRNTYNCQVACGRSGNFCIGCKDAFKAKFNKIKNQSENVYDLIDLENDIVKYKFREEDIITKAVDASLSYIIGSYPEDVIAIYKPNSRGDYIKVWEKKMEV